MKAGRCVRAAAALVAAAALASWPAVASADDESGVLPGESIDGSTDAADPTEVTAGIWRDEVGSPGDSEPNRYYEYERTIDDSTVFVSVATTGTAGASDDITVRLSNADETCDVSDNDTRSGVDDYLFTAVVSAGPDGLDDEDNACVASKKLQIEVGRGNSDATKSAPFALRIVEEAPLDSSTGLSPGVALPEYSAPDVEDSEDKAGSRQPAEAPEVGSGAYKGSVTTGDEVFYRVPLDWGQTVKGRLVVNRIKGDTTFGPRVDVRVLSPWLSAGRSTDSYLNASSEGSETAGVISGPVRYLNRYDGDGPYLPGDYYIAIRADSPAEGEPDLKMPFTLQVEVSGEDEDPPRYSQDEPFVVGDGKTAVAVGSTAGAAWDLRRILTVAALTIVGAVSLSGGVRLLRRTS